jgi:RHS repeat-associated protein
MLSSQRMVQAGVASLLAAFFILPTSVFAVDVDSSRFIARPSRIAEPDAQSGAFTQSYELTLPPGRNGMQPSLGLSYNSMSTDNASFVGYGWSLSLPSIKRLSPHGSDELYTRHDFTSALSGELSDITLTDATHGIYGAKVDDGSYVSYTYNTDETWDVVDKAGMTYTFGGDASARVANPSDSTQVYEWMLTSIEDALGNTVTYTYTADGNQVYPESINYTGFGTSPGIFDIEFTLESRSDAFTSYAPGFAVTTSYRISDVIIEVDGQEVRSYALEYDTGHNGARSMLASITETATTEDGISSIVREPTTFSYASGNESWSSASVTFPEIIAGTSGSLGVYMFDMDGDAIADIIKSRPSSQQISSGNGDGTWTSSSVTPPLEFSISSGGDKGVRVMDVNGDSALDIVYARTVSGVLDDAVYINNSDGTGWTEDTAYTVPIGFTSETGANLGVDIFDVDGDGLPDIVKSRDGSTQEVYVNDGDGTGWTLDTAYTVPVYFAGSSGLDQGVRAFDVNGDGLADIVRSYASGDAVYLNNGDGTGWTEDTAWTVPVAFVGSSGIDMGVRPMDVNADGLTDLVYHRTDGSTDTQAIYLNTGSEWTSTSLTTPLAFNLTTGADLGVRVDDIDGDGIADILCSRLVGGTTYNDLYLGGGEVADLMTSVVTSQGAESEITYASSANGDNPNLPFAVQVTESIATDDGLGNVSTKTYVYAEGEYFYDDAFNGGFAGFGVVTATDADGSTISYFSQGNSANTAQGEATDSEAQMGRLYRVERTDDTGHVYRTNIDTWEVANIGTDRDFVLRSQSLELLYGSGSSHVDRATTYEYDASGNLIEQIEWGEGTGADDGSFTDSGTDDRKTEWEYATFSSTSALSSYKKLERLEDHGGAQIRFTRWFYDDLSFGSVDEGLFTKVGQSVSTSTAYDTTFTYDSYGLLATTTDPASYVTTYTSDAYDLYPATVTNALSQDTDYTYDYSSGGVVTMTDANGVISTTEYDALDRPLEVIADGDIVIMYAYDNSTVPSEVHKTDWFDGSTARETYVYYDGFSRQIQVRAEAESSGMYNVADTVYDDIGRVEEISLPYEESGSAHTSATTDADLITTTAYDALDRPVSVTNVLGTATTSYSGRQHTETDVNGNVTLRTFDALGRLASVGEQEGSSTYTTSYSYTAADQLAVMNDPTGNVRNFTYDQRGARLTATDLHASSADTAYGTWTYTYDSRGLMASAVSPDSITTNYTYDSLGRKTAEDVTASSGTELTYAYDSCTNGVGRLCTATVLGSSATDYDYDTLGNLSAEDRLISGTHYITSYTHDLQGGIVEVTYPDASVATNVLDANGSLDEVGFVDGRTFASTIAVSGMTYGSHGKLTEVTYGNGVVTNYTYDDTELYRLSDLVTTSGSTALQNFSYDYDNLGNISTLTDASDLYADMNIAYTYNARNLLTDAVATSSDSALTYTKNWTYNNIGNIASSTDCGTYTYSGTALGNYANPHAVTNACSKTYNYNHSGNVINDGTYNYFNTPLGQVSQVKSGTNIITSFTYDESGNRISKVSTASGTTITPNSFYTVDGSSYERNIMAGSLGSVATSTYSGSTASLIYHHKDHLGGTHVESDSSGTSVEYILYTPFGGTLMDVKTGSYENDHKYTDKEKDEDTGLYYYGARYYNSTVGMFTAQDPVYLSVGTQDAKETQELIQDPHRLNSYAYSRNNPIKYFDADGNTFQEKVDQTADAINWFYNKITFGAGDTAEEMGRSGVTVGGLADTLTGVAAGTVIVGGAAALAGIGAGAAYVAALPAATGIALGTSFGKLGIVVENQVGDISGFMRDSATRQFHGLDQAITRGVSTETILNTVRSPLVTLQQAGGNILYLSRQAAVVLDNAGKFVTTYGSSQFEQHVTEILNQIPK